MNQDCRFVDVGARVLMASLFLVAGIRKVLTWKMMLGYFAGLGIPLPEIVLPLTVTVEIGGGLALIAGWRLREVALVMAGFTLFTAFIAHRFWMADGAQFNNQLNHFFKNVAITGGFLVLFAGALRGSASGQSSARENAVAAR
ncbi:DoxX family protein [Trinickia dinghuensis]|uniref:DoxX family protein n=1 Tax=Trinickia dinghuensis TaxID=2291023 RepID=A0A3D8K1W0_9BURK|nr:DoxX family protein [Trinickia dinghuensis]RDU98864.1 DoxX family protein [Trinickia dinghuensis]